MTPDDAKKKKAVEHIVYEIMMFNGTSIKLDSGIQDQFEINTLLESFAIHSRNLFDFFYTKKKYEDDMSADDFIIKKKEFKLRRTKKRVLANLTNKANKQIAHLTYSRNNYNPSTKGWNVSTITKNMHNTIVSFLSCLEPRKKEWFKDLYEKYNLKA